MKVKELIELPSSLNQEQEIRYDSYEFIGDYDIEGIEETEQDGTIYYKLV
jgi:hypothetical protein